MKMRAIALDDACGESYGFAMDKTFVQFKAEMLARGFDEVVERNWAPHEIVDTHSHPFTAKALVVRGEMWLTQQEVTRHIGSGGSFELDAAVPHAERYGSEGATYWVARRGVTSA